MLGKIAVLSMESGGFELLAVLCDIIRGRGVRVPNLAKGRGLGGLMGQQTVISSS